MAAFDQETLTSMPALPSFFDVAPVAKALANGLVILTPNQRLASRISSAYAIYCADNGHKVVAAPRILSYDNWLQASWQQLLYRADPVAAAADLLSADQELLVWQDVVANTEEGQRLLRPQDTAKQLKSAYAALADWGLDYRDATVAGYFSGEDDQLVKHWFAEFDGLCSRREWMSAAHLPAHLEAAYNAGRLDLIGDIALVGFEELSPQQTRLLEVAGNQITLPASRGAASSRVQTVGGDSVEQEAEVAAAWARAYLRDKPSARVAVVFRELAQKREP